MLPYPLFDLQVNGYGGIDFNKDDLTGEELHTACTRLKADGVEGILATIITEQVDKMADRLAAIVRLREKDPLAKKLILGLHIEGPFINENAGYRGAHPQDAIHPANQKEMNRLLDAAGGLTRIVTLAPERDPGMRVTRMLAKKAIMVSGGHSDASVDDLQASIDAGLKMFTHLGNGCPMQMHRHDNIIQRVLSLSEQLWITFIADGAHVPFVALGNYLRLVGLQHAILVTDAIAPAGLGPGRYTLGRWDLEIGEDHVARAPDGSHLVGSALRMADAISNLKKHVGMSDQQIEKLVFSNPVRCVQC